MRERMRLIPAHAGKTLLSQVSRLRRPAHPRACGENGHAELCSAARAGSSPRMRGKPLECILQLVEIGLIPAHAGKTL